MRVLLAVGVAGCAHRTCPAANEPRAVDDVVSGVSARMLAEALDDQPFAEVAVAWRDGPNTRASASIVLDLATATRVQREDCLAECRTRYHVEMACGPDVLSVAAHGTVSTADGRIGAIRWHGRLTATALRGPIEWRVSSEPTPVAEVDGTLDPIGVAEVSDPIDPGVRVHLGGRDGLLATAGFDLAYARQPGATAHSVSTLGGTPRP